MKAALLSIGTELTRGELINTNAVWLAEQLSSRGYLIHEIVTVSDQVDDIVATLHRLSQENQLIIATGGLGPTTDDLTAYAVARALGRSLVRDATVLQEIQRKLTERKRILQESNARQADFPSDAQILPNEIGIAPGFAVSFGSCRAFFLPGVPYEMRSIFMQSVLGELPPPTAPTLVRYVQCFGMPESQMNDHLQDLEESHQVTLGYRASHAQVEVKILLPVQAQESREDAEQRIHAVQELVIERLGGAVYTTGKETLPETVGRIMRSRQITLALAESCTGGLLSEMLTAGRGASRYYQGGVCTYSNDSKTRVLGVRESSLDLHGAVSTEVAYEMAEGAKNVFQSDYALSVTGIAGPTGGSADKPVGLVHLGLATPESCRTFTHQFTGDRIAIQQRAANMALWHLFQELRIATPQPPSSRSV